MTYYLFRLSVSMKFQLKRDMVVFSTVHIQQINLSLRQMSCIRSVYMCSVGPSYLKHF